MGESSDRKTNTRDRGSSNVGSGGIVMDEVEISTSKSKKPSKGWVFVETKAS